MKGRSIKDYVGGLHPNEAIHTNSGDELERLDDLFEVANSEISSFAAMHNRDVRFETE